MTFRIEPVGTIHREASGVVLEVFPAFVDALLGLDGFSHILVFYWLDRNDSTGKRRTLRVHPRGDRSIPVTGVFATRSPRRPNLIGLDTVGLLSVDGRFLHIDRTDALEGTPVIDIKPYIPASDAFPEAEVPAWVHRSGADGDG